MPVVGTGTTRPGGVADTNGFFLQWAGQAVDRGVTGLGGPTVRVESVAARQPDVIVGSAVGADAVTPEIYAQLSAIAPTIVLDHSRLSWQELSAQLGRDLGRVAEATAAEQEYTARASAVGAGLDTSREAVAVTVTDNGFTVFTAESAQGTLLAGLGLRLKAVAPSGASGLGGSEVCRDVVPVAGENAGVFGDASLFFVNATDEDVAGYRTAQPVLGSLPAFAENRVHALGPESFRLDRLQRRRGARPPGAAGLVTPAGSVTVPIPY
ncbi:ABC transporter substrate-binding protein [Pseudonocardia sp. NPDC049154]|uniref:ABC transporter substrate-binding protein n=1 Tax=Pseudonocardia sp. NPDC049154 TaxID=3155501 RepID=UPI00340AC060